MKMKIPVISMIIIGMITMVGCGGGGAKNKVSSTPRDKELYEQADTRAKKGRFDEARLLYNTVITTYPDSEFLPLAKLAIADTFYLEGGTSNLEQAIGGYKDFAQFFPTHVKTCDVKLKIAHSLMRQMGAYNRDASRAKQAEHQLKAAVQTCKVSELMPVLQRDLSDVQQVLGLHELDIARFYIHNRQAYKSGEGRLRDIIINYPNFSYFDESLYLLGLSLIEQEQPEEATEYFTRLVRDYPNSEYSKEGRKYLEKLGKPIPEPSNNNPTPERPGFMGKFGLILGYNGLDISKDGVLLSRKGDEKQDVKDAVKSDANSTATDTKGVRASTKMSFDNSNTANQSKDKPKSDSDKDKKSKAEEEKKKKDNKS